MRELLASAAGMVSASQAHEFKFFQNFEALLSKKLRRRIYTCAVGTEEKFTMVVESYMHPPVHGEHLDILLPGRYENLRRIGSGATSVVYRAHDRFLDLPVAIKCLKSDHSDYHHVRRFQKEAKLMSSLNFVHLPRVFDFGLSQDGHPYMVMELVEGHSLRSIVARKGALSLAESLSIFLQVCSALAYAHNRGVAHRDLKAGNIMVNWNTSGEPVVKLVDFGLASNLNQCQEPGDHGVAVGTPLYMSPEQAMGRPTDARSDIYSFGCLMFETLTGQPPFKGDSAAETLSMHIGTRAPLLSKYLHLHSQSLQEMEVAIAVALEKEPGDRYQSIEELEQALLAIAASEQGLLVEGLFGTGNHVAVGFHPSVALGCAADTVFGVTDNAISSGAQISEAFRDNLLRVGRPAAIGQSSTIASKSTGAASVLTSVRSLSVCDIDELMPDDTTEVRWSLEETDDDLRSPLGNLTNSHEALAACLKTKFQNSNSEFIYTRRPRYRVTLSRVLDIRTVSILAMLLLSALLVGSIVNSIDASETNGIGLDKSGSNEQLNRLLSHEMVVSGTKVWCMPETTIKELAQLKVVGDEVTYLGLCGTQLREGLEVIETWPIEAIDARGLNLTEKGFASLGRLKRLTRLRLDASLGLSATKLERLLASRTLTEIMLSKTNLSDDVVEVLAKMDTVQALYLNQTNMNDEKIAKLAKMKNLKTLTIDGCKDVSAAAVRAFHAKRPDVKLVI